MEPFYKLAEVEKILSVSRATLKRWIYSNQIRAQKIGNSWRISEGALEEFKRRGSAAQENGEA